MPSTTPAASFETHAPGAAAMSLTSAANTPSAAIAFLAKSIAPLTAPWTASTIARYAFS